MSSAENRALHSTYAETPVKVAVGKYKTIHYVHPSVLVQGELALTARVTGQWKNNAETLDWSDFDEKTVECVLKFFYAEYYKVPWLSSGKGEQVLAEAEPTDKDSRTNCSREPRQVSIGNALVIHAKVYTFAERYLVENLKQYKLAQLKDCLRPFLTEYKAQTDPMISRLAEAIQVIYSSTPSTVAIHPARRELCDFVATHHGKFRRHFTKLQEVTGDFMADLAWTLSNQVTSQANCQNS